MRTLVSIVIAFAVIMPAPTVVHGDDCRATRWPYSRDQNKRDLALMFPTLERRALIEYFFSELSAPQKNSLARPLGTYLVGTEMNSDTRTFFKTVLWAADLDGHGLNPRQLDIAEICGLYRTVTSPH